MIDTLEVRLDNDGEEFAMEGVHVSGVLGAGGGDVSPRPTWSAPGGVEVSSYAPDAPALGFSADAGPNLVRFGTRRHAVARGEVPVTCEVPA